MSNKTKNNVVGADISEEAINFCKKEFQNANLKYIAADGTKLPFPDEYFDIIVSFETIEHTKLYKEMLKELTRLLKSTGILILSTPNKLISSPTGIIKNPFHTQEFIYDELHEILKEHFGNIQILGQKYIRYKEKSIKNTIAKLFETFFYMRGFRKLPLLFQNKVIRLIIGKDQYPSSIDYEMVCNKSDILKCKTFYTICSNRKNTL